MSRFKDQEYTVKEFISCAQDKNTNYEELVKNLSRIINTYVAQDLSRNNIKIDDVTVKDEEYIQYSKDESGNVVANKTIANTLKIGDFSYKTNLEDVANDLLNNTAESRDIDNVYETLLDLNSKLIQFEKEYNSKNFIATEGNNDIISASLYAKSEIIGNHRAIENDSEKEAIIKSAAQIIKVAKSSGLDVEVSEVIAKRAAEDLSTIGGNDDILYQVDLEKVDELIEQDPSLVEKFNVLKTEYTLDGKRKSIEQLQKDKEEYLDKIENNETIEKDSVRNTLKRNIENGMSQCVINELVSQYQKGNIDDIIKEYGVDNTLEYINQAYAIQSRLDEKVALKKNAIETYMHENEAAFTRELSSDTYENLKNCAEIANRERKIIDDSAQIDESTKNDRNKIINDIIAKALSEKEKEIEQKESELEEQQDELTKEKDDIEKEKSKEKEKEPKYGIDLPGITSVHINIDKSNSNNKTVNKTEPGPKGDPGEKGDPGKDGKDGEPGQKGDPGENGKDGEPGQKGDPGENGKDGEQGQKGDPGENGKDGKQGQKGDPGEKGKDGEPGGNTYIHNTYYTTPKKDDDKKNIEDEPKTEPEQDTDPEQEPEQDTQKTVQEDDTVIDNETEPSNDNIVNEEDLEEKNPEEDLEIPQNGDEEKISIDEEVSFTINGMPADEYEKDEEVVQEQGENIEENSQEEKEDIQKNNMIEQLKNSKNILLDGLREQNQIEIEEYRKELENKVDRIINSLDTNKYSMEELLRARDHLNEKIEEDVQKKIQEKQESLNMIETSMDKYIERKALEDRMFELQEKRDELKKKEILIDSIEKDAAKSLEDVEKEIEETKNKIESKDMEGKNEYKNKE